VAPLYTSSVVSQRVDKPGPIRPADPEQRAATEDGELYKRGEYIRGLAVLEAQERDRCANFATKAVAAGLAERTVALPSDRGNWWWMVQAALREVDLSPDQTSAFKAAPARQARQLTA
jgi:hypothetical protein